MFSRHYAASNYGFLSRHYATWTSHLTSDSRLEMKKLKSENGDNPVIRFASASSTPIPTLSWRYTKPIKPRASLLWPSIRELGKTLERRLREDCLHPLHNTFIFIGTRMLMLLFWFLSRHYAASNYNNRLTEWILVADKYLHSPIASCQLSVWDLHWSLSPLGSATCIFSFWSRG